MRPTYAQGASRNVNLKWRCGGCSYLATAASFSTEEELRVSCDSS